MIRHFIGSALIACAVALMPSFSDASQSARLMAGDPSGPNVAFSFGGKGVEGLRIITHQVGNPGAKLSIWIDRSRERRFSRILTTEDCKFGGDGAQCRLFFPRTSPDYSRFVVRVQARQNSPRRGPERSGDADEQGYFVRRLYPKA